MLSTGQEARNRDRLLSAPSRLFPYAVDTLQNGETDDLKWLFTYTAAADSTLLGLLKTATDPLGRTTTYTYYTSSEGAYRNGRLKQITYVDSSFELFDYDFYGNLNRHTDAAGRVTVSVFDALDRLVTVRLSDIDPGDGVFEEPELNYRYDAADRLTSMTDGDGNTTTYVYCGCGRLKSITEEHPTDQNLPGPVTLFVYSDELDPNTIHPNRLAAVIEPAGADGFERRTDYGYDALGRVTTVTLPDPDGSAGIQPRSTYTTEYGALGNVLSETDALGNVTNYAYHDRGWLTQVTLPDPDLSDADPARPTMTYVHDAAGQLIQETDALGRDTRHRYDTLGRLVRSYNPVTGSAAFAYDDNGNLTSQVDAVGRVTRFEYDDRDRQTKIIDPRGGETVFSYDDVHNLTSLTDAQGNTTTFAYNNWDLLKTETNELGDSRHYAYEPNTGNLQRVTDRNGRITEFYYDFRHRLTSETWRDALGFVVRSTSYDYDWADQLESVSSTVGAVVDSAYEYDHDALGRTTSIDNLGTTGSPHVVLAQQFDELSRRTGLSAEINGVDDFLNAYAWDGLSRMSSVTQTGQGASAVADKRADFAYNLGGQFTEINRYADLLGNVLVAASHYDYETGTQRLADLRHSTSIIRDSGTTLADYTWTYDVLGRVSTFFSFNDSDTATYAYDRTDQLTGVTHTNTTIAPEDYSHDLTGNRTDGDYQTPSGDNNRLASDGTFTYQYDAEGNLRFKTRVSTASANDYQTEYIWDHRNRLTRVTFSNNALQPTKVVDYTYDIFDRRIGKRVDDNGDGFFDRSEQFIYDDSRDLLLAFADPDGDAGGGPSSLASRFMNAAVDQVMAEELVGSGHSAQMGDVHWGLDDNLGSYRDVVRRVDSLMATESVEHLRFDAFGKILLDTNTNYTQRQTYAGLEYDADTGLYYAMHRWYDPVTHRFISEDPSGLGPDVNARRYVTNQVTGHTDPTGLMPRERRDVTKKWFDGIDPTLKLPGRDPRKFGKGIIPNATRTEADWVWDKRGCTGLTQLRLGWIKLGKQGFVNGRAQGHQSTLPELAPNGFLFGSWTDALKFAKDAIDKGHEVRIFAIQFDGDKIRGEPGNISVVKGEEEFAGCSTYASMRMRGGIAVGPNYNYATLHYGSVPGFGDYNWYWEWMGNAREPVRHSPALPLTAYKYTLWGVAVYSNGNNLPPRRPEFPR